MRIQKYISSCGVCSRREAERKIEEGSVLVNGKPARIGMDVDPESDKVSVDGVEVRDTGFEKVALAMNKPVGVLCTNSDPFGGKTVFDLLPPPYDKMKMFCCGRLDKNSRGLVILTNDGDLANKITHPSGGIVKRYSVVLNRPADDEVIETLLRGVVCDGEKLRALKILRPQNAEAFPKKLEVWLSQGRKREIRRMFEAMGHFVKDLKRFRIGGYELHKIPEGDFKKLSKADILKLTNAV